MGRVKNTIISASDFVVEKVKKENIPLNEAVKEAVTKFGENETAIFNRASKILSDSFSDNSSSVKPSKSIKGNKDLKKAKRSVWLAYVGPVSVCNVWHDFVNDIVSIKAGCSKKDGKEAIIQALLKKERVMLYISDENWAEYAKEFQDESKCSEYIKKASFNNSFKFYTCNTKELEDGKLLNTFGNSVVGLPPENKSQKTFKKKKTKKNVKDLLTANGKGASREYLRENYRMNDACIKAIEKFNNLSEKTDEAYTNLKTYGIDSFTPLRMNDVVNLVSEDAYNYANGHLEGKDLSSSLKWYLRGLSIEDAVKKVQLEK